MTIGQTRGNGVRIRDFLVLATNQDTVDKPAGAMDRQKNLTCIVRGKVQGRRGLRQVKWDN